MSEEEQLIKSGFDSIIKAFNIKNEKNQMLFEEKNDQITDLQSKLSIITEQIDKLHFENTFLKSENKQLKTQNSKLHFFLEETQNKLKMIQKSVIENTSLIQNNNESNQKAESNIDNIKDVPNDFIIDGLNLFKEKDIFHQYKKHSTISAFNISERPKIRNTFNHNANTTKHHHPIMLNNEKYSNIETKINKIKGNLSSRENAIVTEYQTHHMRINSSTQFREKAESQPSTRLTTPNHKPNIRAKILSEGKQTKQQMKNDRYELINQFLNECNLRLDPQVFEQILIVFQSIKDKNLSEENGKEKIHEWIQEDTYLVSLLKQVFKKKANNF